MRCIGVEVFFSLYFFFSSCIGEMKRKRNSRLLAVVFFSPLYNTREYPQNGNAFYECDNVYLMTSYIYSALDFLLCLLFFWLR